MGGKSTLLRQVCLATLLAQVGACVPAQSLSLHPVDAVFVRMGAKDHIMTGQSTFFVELSETAAMLQKATSRSLVALDELGRGTATLDGAAIAAAVLQHMSSHIGCRGLFATHYHHLSDVHASDPRVSIMHMACAVSGGEQQQPGEAAGGDPMELDQQAAGVSGGKEVDDVQEVTFLYRLTQGACPKSYGTNVARLAGLPASVVQRAAHMSCVNEQAAKQAGGAGAGAMQVDAAQAPEQQQQVGALQEALRAVAAAVKGAEGAGGDAATALKASQQQVM
mmetsp:Transcript_20117/g.43814  ORF Transcript_20117/g.43814 Transcript_20117/m.43814 type:complete len:279 (+) Transcript_20117:142-978(+)